jgi:hypothetical protein
MWKTKREFINKGLSHLKPEILAWMLDELIFYARNDYRERFKDRLQQIINFCDAMERNFNNPSQKKL